MACEATIAWENDVKLMNKAIHYLFNNDFTECENTLRTGFDKEIDKKTLPADYRDMRGAFALLYALVSLMKGIASLADDQLNECADRLKAADELSSLDSNWAGKNVVRGICTLTLGLVQILQQSWVPGAMNVFKSWTWIRHLENEGVLFEGREAIVVRSAALFTLGAFYILIGILPSNLRRLASWFTFDGTREKGIEAYQTCFDEDGIMKPWAALSIVYYYVDIKTFLGERLTEKELTLLHRVMDWAHTTYPDSLFYSGAFADYNAVTARNPEKAYEVINAHAVNMDNLPALKWVLNYKRGSYRLCVLDFFHAGIHFKESLQVYIDVNRRSMVPFMAAYALLCFSQSEVEDVKTEESGALAMEMVELLKKYKAMNKKNWGRQDLFGFKILNDFENFHKTVVKRRQKEKKMEAKLEKKMKKKKDSSTNLEALSRGQGRAASPSPSGNSVDEIGSESSVGPSDSFFQQPWCLLTLVEVMILQVRTTWWASDELLNTILRRLDGEARIRAERDILTTDDKFRHLLCKVEIYRQLRESPQGFQFYQQAMCLENQLSKQTKQFGYVPIIHFFAAQIAYYDNDVARCKLYLNKTKNYPIEYDMKLFLMLKTAALTGLLGTEIEQFQEITVVAGGKKTIMIDIPQDSFKKIEEVRWFWIVSGYSVNFSATLYPHPEKAVQETEIAKDDDDDDDDFESANEDDDEEQDNISPILLQTFSQKETKDDEATTGVWILQKKKLPCTIELVFDNTFSYMRGKTVKYRIFPENLKLTLK